MSARSWGAGPKMSDRGGGCEVTSAIPCFATAKGENTREGLLKVGEKNHLGENTTLVLHVLYCAY